MLVRFDTLEPWKGEPLNGVSHPRSIETLWTPEALAAIGLAAPTRFVVPEGRRAIGPARYVRDRSGIREVRDTEPIVLTLEQVNAERDRRIMALLGVADITEAIYLIINGNREATRMMNKELRYGQPLDANEQARVAELEGLDAALAALDQAAASLKATAPIPLDFISDVYWP